MNRNSAALWCKAVATVGACLMAAATALPTHAEDAAPTRVLKGKQVNEANLLDALTPEAPAEEADGAVVTRSLKVSRDVSTPTAVRRPSASLLITFETNSATLTGASRDQLDVVAAALKNDRLKTYTFNVEGHADPRGNADSNLLLSQQRADSVRRYLVNAHQIDNDRLRPVGKGDTELLNTRDVAAPENRRVTIVTNAQ